MDDRSEQELNRLHVIALMIGRGQKHVNLRNHLMAQKYLQDAKDFIEASMHKIRAYSDEND
jgi:hypothetical protein